MKSQQKFPANGRDWNAIETDLDEMLAQGLWTRPQNRLMLGIHSGSEETHEVAKKAYMKFFHQNALVAEADPLAMGRMQNDILSWTADLLNGGDTAKAAMMTGGTESIFCALHAARQWARATKPEIKEPFEIVAPWSIHATFEKGAHYLDMKVIRVPIGADYRADPAAMSEAITPNTIMVAGSAPSWGFGLVDPLEDIAKLAAKHDLWMHVDACVGGFLLPFLERCGEEIPVWDFRIPEVSSISADIHKHGYAAKPASTVTFKNQELYEYNLEGVAISNWQSGTYKAQGFVGSRPGSAVAAAWAVMSFLGEDGYTALTQDLLNSRARMIAKIEDIHDFWVLRNHCLMVPCRSETLDMMKVFGGLVERGYFPWGTIEPLFVHPSAELVANAVTDKFLADLEEVAQGVISGEITAEAMGSYVNS